MEICDEIGWYVAIDGVGKSNASVKAKGAQKVPLMT